ncbi:MAG TPA: hypothetical protein VHS28_03770, partial [Chloroflexota bacterium]|nr:hypothetical protein [Chloroflexota bacterium]
MAATEVEAPVISLGDAIRMYYDLLEESRGLDEQLHLIRGRILAALAERRLDSIQVDGVVTDVSGKVVVCNAAAQGMLDERIDQL